MQSFVKYIDRLWTLCLALFFCRTVFIGYRYLFFLMLVPCAMYACYACVRRGVGRFDKKKLILPFLVIALYFVHFTTLSNVVKESVNIALILYFIAFPDFCLDGDKSVELFKWIVRLTIVAGVIAIIRFIFIYIGLQMYLPASLFEGGGFALVNDYNFYSLFFLLALVLTFWLFVIRKVRAVEYIVVFVISTINIVAPVSRRGYVLFALIVTAIFTLSIIKYHCDKKSLFVSISPIVLMFVCGVALAYPLLCKTSGSDMSIEYKYYKLHTLLFNDISFEEYEYKSEDGKYGSYPIRNDGNLFNNGDLCRGLDGWSYKPTPYDCITFNLVTYNDTNVIRIERGCSSGEWQLHYCGRPIVYHKNVTYDLSFLYRLLEGTGKCFNVGWWVYEGGGYAVDLPQNIVPIDGDWNKCEVSYKFCEDHLNPHCFLSSLVAGSTIEVKDISLTCNDTTGLPMYVDQLSDSVIHSFYVDSDTINYLAVTRLERWRYAWELWQTRYSVKQKIFGHGFDYLEWYGEKFYGNPKRYDFPHNPIISSFLYSGIIGGIVYILFLLMSLWHYWEKRHTLGMFFIMDLCCRFFCMFSGSSHFSFPLFAFLSFLPFVENGNASLCPTNNSLK